MTDAEGLGVKLEDRETVIKELKKSLKIKVIQTCYDDSVIICVMSTFVATFTIPEKCRLTRRT